MTKTSFTSLLVACSALSCLQRGYSNDLLSVKNTDTTSPQIGIEKKTCYRLGRKPSDERRFFARGEKFCVTTLSEHLGPNRIDLPIIERATFVFSANTFRGVEETIKFSFYKASSQIDGVDKYEITNPSNAVENALAITMDHNRKTMKVGESEFIFEPVEQ